MFSFLMKKAGYWLANKQESNQQKKQNDENDTISKNIADNIQAVKEQTHQSNDIVVREFAIGCNPDNNVAIVFVDGLASAKIINDDIIKSLMFNSVCSEEIDKHSGNLVEYIKNSLISVNEVETVDTLAAAMNGFLNGDALLFINGVDQAIIINSKGWEKRSVSEPAGESVVRGPRESFVENLRTNTSLIRRKIKHPALTVEPMVIGRKTRTNISIAYISGVAKAEVVAEVKKRLKAIDTDSILESGYIEQFIEDSPGSIFATIGYTEKPDVAAAKILEGRVAIVVDGTPFVLTVPFLFLESFQAAEDYYFRPYFATLLRLIRIIGFAVTILAPAFYVAVTTYHQELIPTELLITMASAREGVPFPAFVESLVMIIVFEILREAGIRLPRPVGQALSIVGALVIGESAVSAGLIGAPMVIVVAITAVSGFVVPFQADSAAVLRMILLVLGSSFGGFGMTIGMLGILVHMSSLESFGFSYLSPSVPFVAADSKDAIIRAPLWMMIGRPKGMAVDKQRQKYNVPPAGSDSEEG